MSFATLDDLRSQLGESAPSAMMDEVYRAKMLHPIPEGKSVKRETFILDRVKDKTVLEFGASGPMHDAVVKVARQVYGVDLVASQGVVACDLDDVTLALPSPPGAPDLILCGEVIEHLANPGWFLQRLRAAYQGVPILVTVPNAYCDAGRQHLKRGMENVNRDHVAWYSPKTLSVLLARYGFPVIEFAWYNGTPPYAEGLLVVTE